MRLALVGGCLEPGQDGVGDFLGRLERLARQAGHEVIRIGLADHLNDADPHQLRLDRRRPWTERATVADRRLTDFQPDVISWHVVPYAYQPKGVLPAELGAWPSVVPTAYRHLWLHELWIGEERGAPWVHRAWRLLQRPRLRRFLQRWHADRIETTNPVYAAMLADLGFSARVQPLVGNIPVLPGVAPLPTDPSRPLEVVAFGTLHPAWDPAPTTAWLTALADHHPVHVRGVGRIGAHGEQWLQHLSSQHPSLRSSHTGPVAPGTVSRHLQQADLGLATHPWALLGKSGAVAAYLDHGLPVLAARDDWQRRHRHPAVPAPGPGVIRLAELPPAAAAAWCRDHRRAPDPGDRVGLTAWLAELQTEVTW